MRQSEYSNSLILSLSSEDFLSLKPYLELATLDLDSVLGKANVPVDHVCFPESGIISVLAAAEGLASIEVGLVGFEGVTGLAVIMGDVQSPEETYVLAPGRGHRVTAVAMAGLIQDRPTLRQSMLGFARVFATQIAQTALTNARARIEVRLARALLMVADRIGDREILLTHDQLSAMLGVRRPGITDAIHRLEGDLLIRARRGSLTIRDRAALEAKADGFYGVPEREYERVVGPVSRPAHVELPPASSTNGRPFPQLPL